MGLVWLGMPAAAKEANPKVLVDEDYRITLKQPSSDWALMDEEAARALIPDAVMGARMVKEPHVHAAVIVERAEKQSLEWFANAMVNNMPLEDKKVVSREAISFNGVPAIRAHVVGKLGGLRVRYLSVVVVRQAFVMRIVTWGLESLTKADGSDFMPVFNSLSFTEGPIRIRKFVPKTPDMLGTGWEVARGVFQSAVSGLRVAPPDGWRLLVGDELANVNNDAEVGMTTTEEPQAYIVFMNERAVDMDRAALEKRLTETLQAVPDSKPLAASIAGAQVSLPLFQNGANPYDYRLGIFWHGDRVGRALAWHGRSDREKASAKLVNAFTGVTRLSATDQGALMARLRKAPDTQNAVGPDFALRSGTFVDFANGVSWKAPKGIWKLSTGQAARDFLKGATLLVEAPAKGILGVLRHDPKITMGDAEYHKAVLEMLWGKEDAAAALPSTKEVNEAGRPRLRIARATRVVGGQTFTYVVATGVHNGHGTRFMFWGWPGNVAASVDWLKEALWGLNLAGAPAESTTITSDMFRDARLGFAFKSPSPGHKFRDQTPAALRPIGRIIGWSGKTERAQAMAVCNVGNMENTKPMVDRILTQATRSFPGTPIITETTVGGLPAQRRSWAGKADVWSVVRGRTVYLVILERRGPSQLKAEDVLAGFTLLD